MTTGQTLRYVHAQLAFLMGVFLYTTRCWCISAYVHGRCGRYSDAKTKPHVSGTRRCETELLFIRTSDSRAHASHKSIHFFLSVVESERRTHHTLDAETVHHGLRTMVAVRTAMPRRSSSVPMSKWCMSPTRNDTTASFPRWCRRGAYRQSPQGASCSSR